MPGADETRDLDTLIQAVRAGGEIARARQSRQLSMRRKADGSPVTDADEAVDQAMAQILRGARPDYAWLSEESADPPDLRRAPRAWIVDPIDGTRGFMNGSDAYCQAACVTQNGRAIAGAIFRPATGELFSALRGAGAKLNGQPIQVRTARAPAEAVILANRSVFGVQAPFSIKPISALCLALAEVAAGRADAIAALGLKSDWDLAAGTLLVEEAGGLATRADGGPFAFNQADPRQPGLLAAGPPLHDLLSKALAARGHDSES